MIAPLPMLPAEIEFGAILPGTTEPRASLALLTACLRILADVTAPCLSCLGPTLFCGRPAATATPPRAANSARLATTFE